MAAVVRFIPPVPLAQAWQQNYAFGMSIALLQPWEAGKPNIRDPILGKESCLLSLPNCVGFLEGCIYIVHEIFKSIMLTSMLRLC